MTSPLPDDAALTPVPTEPESSITPFDHLRPADVRDAAHAALILVDDARDALLVLLVQPADPARPGTDDTYQVLGANRRAERLFGGPPVIGQLLHDLSTAFAGAVAAARLSPRPLAEQRLTLPARAFAFPLRRWRRTSVRRAELGRLKRRRRTAVFKLRIKAIPIEDVQFIGMTIREILPDQRESEDEVGLMLYPIDDERTLGRRVALRTLYEIDSAGHDIGNVMTANLRPIAGLPDATRIARRLIQGVLGHRAGLDAVIARIAPEFPLDQLAVVDRNILRIAMYEFAVAQMTPVGAAIDEAVELAKVFGAEGSPGFVNGVLGALANDAAAQRQLYDPAEKRAGDAPKGRS